MSGKVVFALTAQQAAALIALYHGEHFDYSGVSASLLKRGLAVHEGGVKVLTPLGEAAAAVAQRLALAGAQ